MEIKIGLNLGASIVCVTLSVIFAVLVRPPRERQMKVALLRCKKEVRRMIEQTDCHPAMLRLAWSDAVSYDQTITSWPRCGGVNGSVQFPQELNLPGNAGLSKAVIMLNRIKKVCELISWADLIQMSGALAVELAGGPVIKMRYGREDCPHDLYEEKLSEWLPSSQAPFPDSSPSADTHLRNVFYRLGFTNKEIVALCGGHTLGRAFSDRTGVCSHCSGEAGSTPHTRLTSIVKNNGRRGVGMPGGISWTEKWLAFDNSYFKRIENPDDPDLLLLPTDRALFLSPEFLPYARAYAADEELFFQDYANAHRKMSELGAKFCVPGGIVID